MPNCANYKAAGCDSEHTATDENCPTALAELERLNKYKRGKNMRAHKFSSTNNNPSWHELRKAMANKKSAFPALRNVIENKFNSQNAGNQLLSYANVAQNENKGFGNRRSRSRTRANLTHARIAICEGISRKCPSPI